MTRRRSAFTLVEMLVAMVLAALLMGGVLLMTAALARDRNRVTRAELGAGSGHSTALALFRFDLTNALTMSTPPDARLLVLIGHGGLDPITMLPTGRLTRVTYELRGRGVNGALFRTQEYLDEPARPQAWTELVADGVLAFGVAPESHDFEMLKKGAALDEDEEIPVKAPASAKRPQLQTYTIATRLRVRLQRPAGGGIDQEIWAR